MRRADGLVGRGWLALQPDSGELLACEASAAAGGGEQEDVNLQELEALRGALLYAATVAVDEDWITPDLAGTVISGSLVGELRGLAEDVFDEALAWIG